jgi:hypothetical protein
VVNQQIVDWIKSQEAQGYDPQQLYSYLIQQGYNSAEVNDALNFIAQPSRPMSQQAQPIKPHTNILPILIISLVVIVVVGGGFYFMSQNNKETSNPNLNLNNENIKTAAEPVENLVQNQQPAEVKLDLNCSVFALSDKLDSCSKYKCQFTHPFTGEPMVREILGIVDGKCDYVEQMPNNGTMECKYTESMRKAVAKHYKDVAAAESVGTEVHANLGTGETQTKYTIDGKEVYNPLDEAMSNGQCVISGY